ncbi:MAG TPA: sigma-70 family RNA polymerase sigma factor [Pseudonocardiaceae bacterium]|nr:sigma-70 family RNA polymerase sigma factor [Pseudonocardiaceae bacterium]
MSNDNSHHQRGHSMTTFPDESDRYPNVTELLRLVGDGDQAAWDEIIRRYRGLVSAKVRMFRLQEADADDATQLIWLRLMENYHRIRFPELLGPWLATTARNECLSILRAAGRSANQDYTMMDKVTDPADDPEQQVISRDTARMLHDLVAELGAREQTIIRALFSDQPPSYAELADIVRIPLGSVGPTRIRALRKLQGKLDALRFSAA